MRNDRNARLLAMLRKCTIQAHMAWDDWCSHLCRETKMPLDKWNRRRDRVAAEVKRIMDEGRRRHETGA